jgi:hypothetical protein
MPIVFGLGRTLVTGMRGERDHGFATVKWRVYRRIVGIVVGIK